jgi:eukaryotic-like serine/threonine-protein kinase
MLGSQVVEIGPRSGGLVLATPPLLAPEETVQNGHFQATERIHSGDTGEIYKATEELGGDDIGVVALKLIQATEGQERIRADLEVGTHALLDGQPGITPLRGTGSLQKDGKEYRYAVTPFAEDGTLKKHMAEVQRDPILILDIAAQILPAMVAMDELGVTHNDLKPGNILAGEGDTWAINDFGNARVDRVRGPVMVESLGGAILRREDAGADPEDFITLPYQANVALGTLGFIAPETFTGTAEIGPKADVFSFGVIMYMAVTGKAPFDTTSFDDYMLSVTREAPVPVEVFERAVPADLGKLTMECLERDPDRRPTAADLLERVHALST